LTGQGSCYFSANANAHATNARPRPLVPPDAQVTKREKVSAVDTAWLRMDRPGNLMMICGVLVFGERVTRARLLRVLKARFLAFPRFRERPVETPPAG